MRGEAGPGRLRHRVLASIHQHRLWSPGDRVVVAVSGGLDSVALLDLLLSVQDAHGAVLEVVTVDHGTRPDSAADADFVAELTLNLNLRLHRADLALGSTASEADCRTARHAVFAGLTADRIALAHHRDDQAETVLLQLLRGTGTRGLAAMGWRGDRLVRPLLELSREDLRAWAAHRDLRWREDPSNADPRFLRNRVRAEVLPLLESIRPGAAQALARSAAVAGEDDAWLESLVDSTPEALGAGGQFDAGWVAEAPAGLVGRALRRLAPQTTSTQVRAVREAARRGSGAVQLEGGGLWEVLPLDGAQNVVRFRSAPLPPGP